MFDIAINRDNDSLRQNKPSISIHNVNTLHAKPALSAASVSHPGIAALLSLMIPGAGQMDRGRVGSGMAWLICTAIGYLCFIVPGLILHLICIIKAATDA